MSNAFNLPSTVFIQGYTQEWTVRACHVNNSALFRCSWCKQPGCADLTLCCDGDILQTNACRVVDPPAAKPAPRRQK